MGIEVAKRFNAAIAGVDNRIGLFVALMLGIEAASLLPFVNTFHRAFAMDFGNFWAAGGTVGTPALLDPAAHRAWQLAHHLVPQAFVYVPGFAWFYAPFYHLPLLWAFALNNVLMGAFCYVIVTLAASVYGLTRPTALVLIAAWYPVFYTVEVGQNTLLALALILLACVGMIRNNWMVSGLAVGALLYKPTDAFIFVLFLLVRRDVRAFAVALACGVFWYLLSVAAAAGDWAWPAHYVHVIRTYFHGDFDPNAFKALSIPAVLMALGTPVGVAAAIGVALATALAFVSARLSVIEAVSMLPLGALLTSVHAWPYELVILVPTICWLWKYGKPLRDWVLAIAYVLAATWWLTIWELGFDPLAIIVIGGSALWLGSIAYRTRSRDAAFLYHPDGV